MNKFHVWLRPLGDMCRVRVDGMENAKWLLDQLSRSFIFKTSEPFGVTAGSTVCSFAVPYNTSLSRSKFERTLAAIPELTLMTRPE